MSFTDYNTAARTREAIKRIAKQAYREMFPPARWATVTNLDRAARTVTVEYPDEVGTTSIVACRAMMPHAIGQQVRVGGPVGRRYVTEVIGLGSLSEQPIGFPFAANWENFSGAWSSAVYWREGQQVHLAGLVRRINSATSGTTTIGTLPSGYRPFADHIYSVAAFNGSLIQGRLNVLDTGVVSWDTQGGSLPATTGWVSLSNVSILISP